MTRTRTKPVFRREKRLVIAIRWIGFAVLSLCLILISLLLAFAWQVHRYEAIARVPETNIWVPSSDTRLKIAGLVLTGDAGRLDVGYALLLEEEIQNLYISGVSKGVRITDLERVTSLQKEAFQTVRHKITLGHAATTTRSNAVEAASWFIDSDFQVILLITSSYHMPRALLLHMREMPDKIFVPYPTSTGTGFRTGGLDKRSMTIFLREFIKYLGTLAGF